MSLTLRRWHSHHLSLCLCHCRFYYKKYIFFSVLISLSKMEKQIESGDGGGHAIFLTPNSLQSPAPLGVSVCEGCCMELLFLLDHYFPTKRIIIGRHGSKLSGNNNSKQFPSTYCVPDTVGSPLHIIFQGILRTILGTCCYYYSHWHVRKLRH